MRTDTALQLKSKKGFTLVELIVVLVIMMILITLSVAGIFAWQDWSRFKKENTSAETIFYAIQNQFTELDASGAFENKVTKTVKDNSEMVKADYNNHWYFDNSTISYEKNQYYKWSEIWINTPSGIDDSDLSKYQGSICTMSAKKGDYDRYLNNEVLPDSTILLFDLITPYISDKAVLNGAIWAEFSPQARQVFSVCYSDRTEEFSYFDGDRNTPSTKTTVSLLKREEDERHDVLMGYFCANTLSVPPELGRDRYKLGQISLENKETLNVLITEKANTKMTPESNYVIDVCPVVTLSETEEYIDVDSPLMTLEIKRSEALDNTSFQSALSNLKDVRVTFSQGYYASDAFKDLVKNGNIDVSNNIGNNITMNQSGTSFNIKLPVWKEVNAAGQNEIRIVLDAADAQAQSYLCADKKNPRSEFINTFSFYRFGFDLENEGVYKIGCVLCSDSSLETEKSNTESPVFAKAEKTGSAVKYYLDNGRHLYNVRFETDYKTNTKTREFILEEDIDWAAFTSSSENWFLNSYPGASAGSKKYGINYDGMDYTINKSDSPAGNDTSKYAFPGFRCLGVNDTFRGIEKGTKSDGSKRYTTISNLYISFSANMSYGVYGREAREEWLANPIENYGKYNDLMISENPTDWDELYRFDAETHEEKHPSHYAAMKGRFPLGLFAENSGIMENFDLNRHRVEGMEEVTVAGSSDKVLVYTNMVGGFAGNNLGKMQNLSLRDVSGLSNPDTRVNEAGITHVNGKTDVGGILGRESWSAYSDKDPSTSRITVTLKGLNNYGRVTGMENVGGVVGRAYLIRDFASVVTNDANRKKDIQNYYSRRTYYDDGYDIYGEFGDSGTYKEGSSKSILGRVVFRVEALSIEDCESRGEVCGDELVYVKNADGSYKYTIECYENIVETQLVGKTTISYTITNSDLTNYTRRCAFIGGIAGITMDGSYYDFRNAGHYTSDWHNNSDQTRIALTVKNCNAYRLYSDTDLNDIKSAAGKTSVTEGHIKDLIRHDFYKGGLIGYCRFTTIENCGNTPGETITSYKPFVFGRNYVGGLFGCYDFANLVDTGAQYNAVNSQNVVGIMYVGGFAGGTGIGCCKQENFSFKHPSTNQGSQPSQIDKREKEGTIRKAFNQGVVLAIKREAAESSDEIIRKQDYVIHVQQYGTNGAEWQEQLTDEYDAGIGGIVGITRIPVNNANNIQTIANKKYALSLIGITVGGQSDSEIMNAVDYNTYQSVYSNSLYGGNGVGGIVGITLGSGNINNAKNTGSSVNAIVFGKDIVGGVVGSSSGKTGGSAVVYNAYPQFALIMGRNMVGGVAGINNLNLNTAGNNGIVINDCGNSYKVFGQYGVGGVVGAVTDKKTMVCNIVPSDPVTVCGKAYVGGYAGIRSADCEIRGQIKNVNVNSNYFAGGAIGADVGKDNNKLSTVSVKYTNGTITANMFAGGLCGLYNPKIKSVNILGRKNIDTGLIQLANDIAANGFSAVATSESGGILACAGSAGEHVVNADSIPDSTVKINATDIGAGGLFGYLTGRLDALINCNCGSTSVGAEIMSNGVYGGLAYTGGIVGMIPSDVSIRNASFDGKITKNGIYLGEISEINYGAINICRINGMDYCRDENIYAGGLTGNNSGMITDDCFFSAGETLTGVKYLGGFTGYHAGSVSLSSTNLSTNNTVLKIGSGNGAVSDTAIGMVAGYNIGTINLSNIGKITATRIKGAEAAGVIAGINSGTIFGKSEDSLRYTIDSVSDSYDTDAYIYTENVKCVGLIAGRNEGTIRNICINNPASNDRINIVSKSGETYAGAITGQNGGSKKGSIQSCINLANVGSGNSNTDNAGGIAGLISGESEINKCDNHGTITGNASAGGIAATGSASPGNIRVTDCANTGNINSATETSGGIIATTSGAGVFELCRNYGTGAKYAITADSDAGISIRNSLEAGGLNEGTDGSLNPMAPVNKALMVRDFYIYGSENPGALTTNPTAVVLSSSGLTDESGWPVQLYVMPEDPTYTLIFKRVNNYYTTGITGNITYNPVNGSNGIDVFKDIDAQFVAMALDETNYPDGDENAGADSVNCGFVGNLVKDDTSSPAPGNTDGGNGTSSDPENTPDPGNTPDNSGNSSENNQNSEGSSDNSSGNDEGNETANP